MKIQTKDENTSCVSVRILLFKVNVLSVNRDFLQRFHSEQLFKPTISSMLHLVWKENNHTWFLD